MTTTMNPSFCIIFWYALILLLCIKTVKQQDVSMNKNGSTRAPVCIRDAQVPLTYLSNPSSYAFLTCPLDIAYIAPSSLPNAGLGVFAARCIPKDTFIGPYLGYKHNDPNISLNSKYAWNIKTRCGKRLYYIDAFYLRNSNWLRFVNSPNTISQENILAIQYNREIMYKVIRDITVGEELLVYYGDWYAQRLGIDTKQFSKCRFQKTHASQCS